MRGKGNIFTKGALILATALVLQGGNQAAAEELTVMTRNLYLGADLTPTMTAENQEQFFSAVFDILGIIEDNDFPARAQVLAAEIVEKKPHLVGLQEAYNFTIDGTNPGPPFNDYLLELMSALAARGADYRVAAVVRNIDLAFPYGANLIRVLDRDVILARGDVITEVVDLDGICRVSADGCNFQFVASLPNPLSPEAPPIVVERGFAAVDAWVDNFPVRFVNTHLETRNVGPFGLLQAAQAFELTQILAALKSEALNPLGAPVVVVGDFNSDPRDQVLSGPFGTIVPPYLQMAAAGFVDAWPQHRPDNPRGYTCCQDEALMNRKSDLYERVDLIFASEAPETIATHLVGENVPDRKSAGLWPSDHAGVVGRMEFAPVPILWP
jgi:endonuclease/exonuclease/phosphatase family metal-dependent hydrolase